MTEVQRAQALARIEKALADLNAAGSKLTPQPKSKTTLAIPAFRFGTYNEAGINNFNFDSQLNADCARCGV